MATFFLDTFFLVTFFLEAVFFAGFFLLIVFLLIFFLVTFFFATLFLLTFFLATFFLLTRFDATFLREAVVFFRVFLAAFFAGIWYSCRIEKRAGLYIDGGSMEAYFFREYRALRNTSESPVVRGLRSHCLFPTTIVLLVKFHYTSRI